MVYTTSEAKRAYPGEVSPKQESGRQTRLQGLKAIAVYADCSETTIKKRVKEEGFPASKTGGTWISTTEQIDAWFSKRVTSGGEV